MTSELFEPLTLARGPAWKNRFALAPLTNQQSHADGTLSEEEFHWLTMRATGGFGLVMTAAAHVQAQGQGFPGQLGAFDDAHLEGLTRLATKIREEGAVSSLQLHHAGFRSDRSIVPVPVGPSASKRHNARALSEDEVQGLRDDFIAAAKRAEKAGFDGVEVHGAHGYVLAQFLSAKHNERTDRYGGSPENRARLVLEIVDGIRATCNSDFQLGLRLSPERYGMQLAEMKQLTTEIMAAGKIDYLDMSLWDVFKLPEEEEFQDRTLLRHFTELPRGAVRLGVAGKIMGGADVAHVIDEGCDFAMIGRAAILRHDFPKRVAADPDYRAPATPVSRAHLASEGVSPAFIDYLGARFDMVQAAA